MQMSADNRRVATFILGALALTALAYWFPKYGFRDARAREEALRVQYEKQMLELKQVEVAHAEYLRQMDTLQDIAFIQDDAQMKFPKWAHVPVEEQKDCGVYFQKQWLREKNRLEAKLGKSGVECLDPDFGFNKLGSVH